MGGKEEASKAVPSRVPGAPVVPWGSLFLDKAAHMPTLPRSGRFPVPKDAPFLGF